MGAVGEVGNVNLGRGGSGGCRECVLHMISLATWDVVAECNGLVLGGHSERRRMRG